MRPMDVLQNAIRVSFGDNSKMFLHFFSPHRGQVFDVNPSVEQGEFNFKSHHNVEVVRDLVRLHPDQGGGDGIQRGIKGVYGR